MDGSYAAEASNRKETDDSSERNGKMNHHQIIGEVRATRERLAAERGYDIRALYEEAKRRQQESDRKTVDLEPRRLVEKVQRGTGRGASDEQVHALRS